MRPGRIQSLHRRRISAPQTDYLSLLIAADATRILLRALLAKSANFQPHHTNLESTLPGHLFFQFLKRRARVFHDRAASEASHVAVIPARLRLIKMLFAF